MGEQKKEKLPIGVRVVTYYRITRRCGHRQDWPKKGRMAYKRLVRLTDSVCDTCAPSYDEDERPHPDDRG